MACKSCGSKNQEEFRTEIAIHLPGLDKPLVFIFPTLLVCLNCGKPEIAEEFRIPRDELLCLQEARPPRADKVSYFDTRTVPGQIEAAPYSKSRNDIQPKTGEPSCGTVSFDRCP
jgi:hypothetical protein